MRNLFDISDSYCCTEAYHAAVQSCYAVRHCYDVRPSLSLPMGNIVNHRQYDKTA